jgi:hypothetical protein
MVKRKGSEKEMEIAEALNFIKLMKKSAPPENGILREFLDEKERTLHENLFNAVFGKSDDLNKDP